MVINVLSITIVSILVDCPKRRSGVYTEPSCDVDILGYHAITVVGHGTLNGVDYWVRQPNVQISRFIFFF